METGSTRVYVVPRSGGGWQLREIPTGAVLTGTDTKGAAVARASAMLERGPGGEVVVLDPDGSVQRIMAVTRARHPRWYLRVGTARWLLPVLLAFQLALRLLDRRTDALEVVLTTGLAVALVWVLVMVVKSRAYDRARAVRNESD